MWWLWLMGGFAVGGLFASILTAGMVDNYWRKKINKCCCKCDMAIPYEIEPGYERKEDSYE